jgi:hypothetical protein
MSLAINDKCTPPFLSNPGCLMEVFKKYQKYGNYQKEVE